MKLLITIIFIICISGLRAQNPEEYSTVVIGEIVPHILNKQKFNESGEIENYQRELFLSVIENDSINVSRVSQQKILNDDEVKRILSILIIEKVDGDKFMADCYIPRHSISFIQDNRIVGFIEICFECARIKTYGICTDWKIDLGKNDYLDLEQVMNEIRNE